MSLYPDAIQDGFKDAGAFIAAAPKGVLHTTEGASYAGARSSYAKGMAPHFTVSIEIGEFQCWQHIDTKIAARALEHLPGTIETNKANCIQIEIVWFAGQAQAMPKMLLDGLAKLMRWIEADRGVTRHGLQFHSDKEGLVLARDTSPIRLGQLDWINFSGWCGHQHVPGNSHWDPGAIDINYLLTVGSTPGVKPVIDPPLDMSKVVRVRKDRYTDTGVYILQSNGAVFAFEGAVFYKGVNGEAFFANKQAANLLWPEEAAPLSKQAINWAAYKYVIQSTDGGLYGRP